jgi:hypothetical protein
MAGFRSSDVELTFLLLKSLPFEQAAPLMCAGLSGRTLQSLVIQPHLAERTSRPLYGKDLQTPASAHQRQLALWVSAGWDL